MSDLNEELTKGDEISKALVEHLENMGAANLSRTVETNDGCYIVEVRKTL